MDISIRAKTVYLIPIAALILIPLIFCFCGSGRDGCETKTAGEYRIRGTELQICDVTGHALLGSNYDWVSLPGTTCNSPGFSLALGESLHKVRCVNSSGNIWVPREEQSTGLLRSSSGLSIFCDSDHQGRQLSLEVGVDSTVVRCSFQCDTAAVYRFPSLTTTSQSPYQCVLPN